MRDVYDNIKIIWLLGRLSNGALSRREFMGRATALGVTAALATTMANKALVARDGKVMIPDGPGWGVEISPAWLDGADDRISALE